MRTNSAYRQEEGGAALFRSFWMGGFEGADHVNPQGHVLSMNQATGHWDLIEEDYQRLAGFGIRTVRESVGWRACSEDPAGFERLARHARTAQRQGVQVIWTLHHYGVPPGLDFFQDDLAARFAGFCEQVARCVLPYTEGAPFFQPINEISYLAWAADAGGLMPRAEGREDGMGHELKCRLVRAALRGCDALWSVAPAARIVHTDPIIHVVGPEQGDREQFEEAARVCRSQYEAWDMICGRAEPGLGGQPRYLDIVGVNYYHPNQWEHPSNERLHWHLADPRRRDPADMLQEVAGRYRRPLFIAETGHLGHGRAEWIDHVAGAVQRCQARGVPIEGICLYPVVDRHDWQDPGHWHRCGLWDIPDPSRLGLRVLDLPLAQRLRRWQRVLPGPALPSRATPEAAIPRTTKEAP
jgi:beta-glucosidase/6-phospho-beta-glucosidase/beta-galactosidase